jgi:hypothetical protein
MLSDAELNIIAGFFPLPSQRLLPVIQRQVSCPQEEIYSTLKSLAARGIVDIIGIGVTTVFSLRLETDEAVDGYQFYVRLRRGRFEKLSGEQATSLANFARQASENVVLLCRDPANGSAKRCGQANLLGIAGTKNPGTGIAEPDTSFQNDAAIVYKRITSDEFRSMKIADAETFRGILNFAFPLKGVRAYFALLYREIGV